MLIKKTQRQPAFCTSQPPITGPNADVIDVTRTHPKEEEVARREILQRYAPRRTCLLGGRALEELVDAPFAWQEGWRYTLPSGWSGEPLPARV